MSSRRGSFADRQRRRDEALHRAQNRANRTDEEQLELLDRAPGVAAREVRRLKNNRGLVMEYAITTFLILVAIGLAFCVVTLVVMLLFKLGQKMFPSEEKKLTREIERIQSRRQ